MKVYRLPQTIRAFIFDMDLTLYTNSEYARAQVERIVAIAAEKQGVSIDEANKRIEAVQAAAAAIGQGRQSLSSILLSWGFTMEDNVKWREQSCEPEKFLKKDPELKASLEELSGSCLLGVVTNNPVSIAQRTLAALGVERCFSGIIGVDTLMIAKPNKFPFMAIVELLETHRVRARLGGAAESLTPETCVSVGDRYDIDLTIPLELGMGGILVDGVEDIYRLPGLLSGAR